MPMQVVETVAELRTAVAAARARNLRIGCVPTMGALHAGHLSLIETARQECEFVVVTIFVNPTQFGPQEDLSRYPRPFEADLATCEQGGASLVFHPSPETVYPKGFRTFVEVTQLSNVFEGASRPGHFRGVTTVVCKLLHQVWPDVAYFGRKDFQQQLIIRKMCQDLDWPCEIRVCPTVREPDGLALSSRNVYLSAEERLAAGVLSRALFEVRENTLTGWPDLPALMKQARTLIQTTPGVELDYLTVVDSETLEPIEDFRFGLTVIVAARVGTTRLIDNVELS